jgi:hypothetical protein
MPFLLGGWLLRIATRLPKMSNVGQLMADKQNYPSNSPSTKAMWIAPLIYSFLRKYNQSSSNLYFESDVWPGTTFSEFHK